MNEKMISDAMQMVSYAITQALPDAAVQRALEDADLGCGKLVLVAAGKAAWQMASAACQVLGDRIHSGVVVTKYDHAQGELPRLEIYEAGHPVPDENSFAATRCAMEAVSGLTEQDCVLFLLSGGGSALFESPLVSGGELADITQQLLACGADIVEMNTIRKRVSAVKGGRFAQLCAPAKVFSIVLSDILGDPLDMIASGPACADSSTCEQALAVVEKYGLIFSEHTMELLKQETPKELTNVENRITGSVRQLCSAASDMAEQLGYMPLVLTSTLNCNAADAGSFLAAIAREYSGSGQKMAFFAGGETTVRLTGKGKGGRNQEIALSAARGISGLENVLIFSVGSDGTDGPTDAAGGWCSGQTAADLWEKGYNIADVLAQNDAYHALEACDGLIMTGPTGTNVNDLSAILIG
ncbi:MAG: glycerate kinase [Oscillospiraceae bacterium]|nr:glycerate kinase [Oscillospiraceae bacterium]